MKGEWSLTMSEIAGILNSHLTIAEPTQREENLQSIIWRAIKLSLSTSYGALRKLAQDEFTHSNIDKFSAATFGRNQQFELAEKRLSSMSRVAKLGNVLKALPIVGFIADYFSGKAYGESTTKAVVGALAATGVGVGLSFVLPATWPIWGAFLLTSGVSFLSGWTADRVMEYFEA
jgi:hypothetical protein